MFESHWEVNIAIAAAPERPFKHVARVRLPHQTREAAEQQFTDLWCERFPASEGWKLSLTYWEITGHVSALNPEPQGTQT